MALKLDIEIIFSSIFGEENSKIFNESFVLKNIQIIKDIFSENIIKLKIANNISYENEPVICNTDYIHLKPIDNKFKIKENYFGELIGYKQEQIIPTRYICYNLTLDTSIYLYSITDEDGELNFTYENFQEFFNKVSLIFPNITDVDLICLLLYFAPITESKNFDSIKFYIDNIDHSSFIHKILNIKNDNDSLKKELNYKYKIIDSYKDFVSSLEEQKLFLNQYLNIEKIYNEYYTYSLTDSIQSFRQDTSSQITINFSSKLDIYEIFNNFIPSTHIPFLNLSNFNKINRGFTVSDIWIKNLTDNTTNKNILKFYALYSDDEKFINNRLDYNNYALCRLRSLVNKNDIEINKFKFELTIEINKQILKNEEDKNTLIRKVIQNLNLQILNNKFDYYERISKGFFMYNLVKKAEYIDISILKHFLTVDEFISFFFLLDEHNSIHKIRSGERTNFYLEGPGFILFNKTGSNNKDLFNFYRNPDCKKLEFKYYKIGNLSKYDNIELPATFEKTKNLSDILCIEFPQINIERLDISNLQSILNVIYIYMIRNKKSIIELYDGCL